MASPNDLQFQEFEEAAQLLSSDPGASTLSVSASNHSVSAAGGSSEEVKLDLSDEEEEAHPESAELLGGQKPAGGFWTFEFYQSFFNVDTSQVLDRIKGSVMPLPGRNFIKHHLRSNPDLYGPFWICVTLVFTVAISGNLSTFLVQKGDPAYHYTPQFHRVTGVERQVGGYSFLETVCVYGYSLFIYIPTSILWVVPLEPLRWTLMAVAMVISGSVLVLTFWPAVREDTKPWLCRCGVIVALHALLAVGCKVSE
ncbi:hypothetical protein WMY93_001922 [Mugilogobius chulae]|uniref:Protein YIPF n=1 Tax=Mugilogobius chulae TaxID=88201 RepID=A0AAW0PY49_9GOBI